MPIYTSQGDSQNIRYLRVRSDTRNAWSFFPCFFPSPGSVSKQNQMQIKSHLEKCAARRTIFMIFKKSGRQRDVGGDGESSENVYLATRGASRSWQRRKREKRGLVLSPVCTIAPSMSASDTIICLGHHQSQRSKQRHAMSKRMIEQELTYPSRVFGVPARWWILEGRERVSLARKASMPT